jgi:hypothetical protein
LAIARIAEDVIDSGQNQPRRQVARVTAQNG